MSDETGPTRRTKAPRRPPDFSPPGPEPRGAQGDPDLLPAPGEDLSYLAGNWRIFQPERGHRWSLDDLVTAHVAARRLEGQTELRLIDLGTGLGSVLLLLGWAFPDAHIWGIEAQASRAARARRSIRFNGAEDRCTIVDGDLRDGHFTLRAQLPGAPQMITGTPPYFDPQKTRASEDAEAAACRIETRGGLEVYLDAAARLLGSEGAVVLCYPFSEGERAEKAGRERALYLSKRLTVVPRHGKSPLILVDLFSRQKSLTEHESLTVRNQDGNWTDAFREIRRRFGMPDGLRVGKTD